MKLFLYIILISVCSLSTVISQNSGWAGKRVLLTTNLVTGKMSPLLNVGLQVVATRSLTFSVQFSTRNYESPVLYNVNEYQTEIFYCYLCGIRYQIYSEGAQSEKQLNHPNLKIPITERMVSIESRYFFSRNVIPAPQGFFTALNVGLSLLSYSGNYYKSLITNLKIDDTHYQAEEMHAYSYSNVIAMGFHFGIGYQHVFAKRLSFSLLSTLDFTLLDITNKTDPRISSGFAKYYGSNVTTLAKSQREYDTAHHSPARSSTGISLYLQLGVFLF